MIYLTYSSFVIQLATFTSLNVVLWNSKMGSLSTLIPYFFLIRLANFTSFSRSGCSSRIRANANLLYLFVNYTEVYPTRILRLLLLISDNLPLTDDSLHLKNSLISYWYNPHLNDRNSTISL